MQSIWAVTVTTLVSLGYIKGMTCSTQLCGDDFSNHYKDPIIQQPVFRSFH